MWVPKLFFLACLFILSVSFFWDDDEKQLKQLYQNAEAAFTNEKYEEAIKAYEDVLAKVDSMSWQKAHMDWRTYTDTVTRLVLSYNEVKKYEEADNRLNKLMLRRPPEEFLGQIKLLKARIAYKKSPSEQFHEMKLLQNAYPSLAWKKEDTSFFHALEFTLNKQYDELLHKAKRCQVTKFYEEAIPLYEELLLAIQKGHYPKAGPDSFLAQKIRFHLAECHYFSHHYEKALDLCEKKKNESVIDCEMIYLAALCFKEKQEYEKAIDLFQRYFDASNSQNLEHYEHALFEMGYSFYRKNQLREAQKYFDILLHFDKQKKKPSFLAAIYAAKIHLRENKPQLCEKLLADATEEFSQSDPLRYECFFLRGQAFFLLGQYWKAKDFFEEALPQNKYFGELTRSACYYLGLTYVKLADCLQHDEKSRVLFAKAEEIFKKLSLGDKKEEAILALAELYLLSNKYFREPDLKKIHHLLSENLFSYSPAFQQESYLLRAQASLTFQEREQLYLAACKEQYRDLERFPEALMLRGLNFFEEGLKYPSQEGYFDQASTCFEEAIQKIEKQDLKTARLLKLEAKSNFYRNCPLLSLELLEKLLTQFQESFEDREETIYLKGLIASKAGKSYFSSAVESFQKILSDYPNGKYVDRSLHMLGTLYYGEKDYEKAKTAFLQLAKDFPKSELASDSLFWSAKASEKLHEDPASLHIQIYEKYPNSKKAPEAYFRQYPYHRYLEKDPAIHAHLKEFPHHFPNSSLLVCVNCLLGMNEEYFEAAESYFEEALTAFETIAQEKKEINASLVYFRYRAILELAELYLSHEKKLDRACSLLTSINEDFSCAKHPYASFLKEKSLYPPIFEESEFTLARVYLKMEEEALAQDCFNNMLKHYDEAKLNKGTFLALLWREQGKLSMKAGDVNTAIKCFEIAQECGTGYLSDDQVLSLWILQSNCHKEKKEYDLAMRLLSRVINADMASKLRLEAMSLRAEIYELQNRPELAVRQLEAAAKKGSFEAQEKLKVKYGL